MQKFYLLGICAVTKLDTILAGEGRSELPLYIIASDYQRIS